MTASTYKLCTKVMFVAAMVAVYIAVVCSSPPGQQPPDHESAADR